MSKWSSIWEFMTHWLRATIELLITVVTSFLPMFLGAIVTTCWSEKGLINSFVENFSYGEVFLYTSAFLAPYAHKKIRKKGDISSLTISIIAIFSFVVGALVFSFVRMESVLSKKMSIPTDAVTYVGLAVVISTLVVWYYSIWADHKKTVDTIIVIKEQQDSLDRAFDSLIGGK